MGLGIGICCRAICVNLMNDPLREQVVKLLQGGQAHLTLEEVLKNFPPKLRGVKPAGAPHTAWQLLEHLRIAQWDIVEFSYNPNHVSPKWPEGYWHKPEGTPEDWQKSCEQILRDLQTMRDLVTDENLDLLAKIKHGDGQTVFREALLIADHNAYHLGQIAFLMRTLEK